MSYKEGGPSPRGVERLPSPPPGPRVERSKMSGLEDFLSRPLGGGRPVPVSRLGRRRTRLSTLLGLSMPAKVRAGAGIELQLRSRHSHLSFMKAWLMSLISFRGRNWPIGILFLYLVYLVGLTALMKYTTDDFLDEEEDSIFDNINIPVTELGIALFFLLSFRTNNSYQRWWDARMQMSMIQSRSLNMARECSTYIDCLDMRKRVLKWNLALMITMRAHLRETRDVSELKEILSNEEMKELVAQPDMVVLCFLKLSECVYTTMQTKLTGQPQLILQMARDNLRQLAENFMLADGIRVTPQPYAYVVHLRFFLVIWLLALPVSYTTYFGWWTILACFVIGIALLGFDSIATKIENPYEPGFNDIPLDAIIQRSKDIVLHIMKTRTGKETKAEPSMNL